MSSNPEPPSSRLWRQDTPRSSPLSRLEISSAFAARRGEVWACRQCYWGPGPW
jgi:hypothetical protein